MLLAVLAVLALAGCGSPWADATRAVGGAAHAAQDATQLSENVMRGWCPQAVANSGRDLSRAQARACLQRAWGDWLRELRRNGWDPNSVGR